MTNKPRFKIDFYDSSFCPFALYFAERGYFSVNWRRLQTFETQEKAKEFYEKIKDLPEYLP